MPPFISDPLPQIEGSNRNVELRELIDFWKNPAKYFVRKRLGLSLWERDECLSDEEPFQLDGLEQYLIKQELLGKRMTSDEPLPPEVLRARGILPAGAIGDVQLRTMGLEVQNLIEHVKASIGGRKKDEPCDVDLPLGTFRISGKIHSLYQGTSVLFRAAKLKPWDHLRAWIEHLVLCALASDGKAETALIGKDAVVTFGRVSSARVELETLCELFWEGSTLPLQFFPESALAFVEAEHTQTKDPFKEAWKKWDGPWRPNEKREKRKGEKDNVFIALCFHGPDPLNERFAALARRVFGPMLAHAMREEL